MKNGSETERDGGGRGVCERERVAEGCDKGWEEIVRWKEKKKRVTKWHPTTK